MADIINSLKRGILLLVFIAILPFVQTTAQDPVDLFDGIPLITYPERRAEHLVNPTNYQQMDSLGLFGVVAADTWDNSTSYLSYFTNHNLRIIPQYAWGTIAYSYIWRYTDAHYTVWEAEGTAYVDTTNGKATLYRSDSTTIVTKGDSVCVKTNTGIATGDTLIYGPGYQQNVTYRFSTTPYSIVYYTAEYNMQIETTGSLPPGYLEDVVCTLMVTNLNLDLAEETVVSREIKVSDFNGWDNWDTLNVPYDLTGLQEVDMMEYNNAQSIAYCIEFKVIWAGLDYLNLYIDKIRIYDDLGFALVEDDDPTTRVATLVQNLLSDSTIVGWYGLDEPKSIDNYEPFRIVDNVVDTVSDGELRLHAGLTGGRYGKFKGWKEENDTLALKLYKDEEFWLRAKPKNIQIQLDIPNGRRKT
jgi:hypothetical protein